jgi:hypothetical protein
MELSGQLHAPATLSPRKFARYPLGRWLGVNQIESGCYGDEIFLLSLSGIEPQFHFRPSCS